jgi:superfamily II DNA or RNA helicase
LEDFQTELCRRLLDLLAGGPGNNRGILTLPTGAGKTRTAVEALIRWRLGATERRTLLWIAQSEELCEQAVQAFREVWIDQGHRPEGVRETLSVYRLWGGGRVIPASAGVVVASIQKLHAIVRGEDDGAEETDERKQELAAMAGQIGAVVIDEAHRMLAPSYTEVLDFLGIELARGASSTVPMIGLTATPYRTLDDETRRLVTRFHGRLLAPSNLGEDPIAALRERGVLSRPVHKIVLHAGPVHSVDDDPKYREYYERFGDLHPELVGQLGQERPRNQQLLGVLLELPADWPTLFFACSVEHAKAITVLLARRGRIAATVSGETRPATRRFLIEEFRAGRISVLCNYGVLTTGFDAPRVRALVISRPTASPVLYEQMIGRGMRGPRFGGTEECLVIDVADNIRFGGQMAFRRYDQYWNTAAA